MDPRQRLLIGGLFILTLVVGVAAVLVGTQLQSQPDVTPAEIFAANCPGGNVDSCTQSCIDGACAASDFPTECIAGCRPACENNCSSTGTCGNGQCDEDPNTCPQDAQYCDTDDDDDDGGNSGGGTTGVCDCGQQGETCCAPQNNCAINICAGSMACNNGVCTDAAPAECSGTVRCRVHICADGCSDYGGGLYECRTGGTIVDCSQASLGGQCGQIDFVDDGGYCGVQTQNCSGACRGTPVTSTPTDPPVTTPPQTTRPPTDTPIGDPIVLCTRCTPDPDDGDMCQEYSGFGTTCPAGYFEIDSQGEACTQFYPSGACPVEYTPGSCTSECDTAEGGDACISGHTCVDDNNDGTGICMLDSCAANPGSCYSDGCTPVPDCGETCDPNETNSCPMGHTCSELSGNVCVLDQCIQDPSLCEADQCTPVDQILVEKSASTICSDSNTPSAQIGVFTIVITNPDTTTRTFMLVDTLDSRISESDVVQTSLTNGGTVSGNIITWPMLSLESESTLTITYQVGLDESLADSSLSNSVVITEGGVVRGTDQISYTPGLLPCTALFTDEIDRILIASTLVVIGFAMYVFGMHLRIGRVLKNLGLEWGEQRDLDLDGFQSKVSNSMQRKRE